MKQFHYSLLIILTSIITVSSIIEAIPPLQIDYSTLQLKTTICLGANKQCFSVVINPSTYYTWIPDIDNQQKNINKFEASKSQTCKVLENYEFFIGPSRLRGKIIEDSLTLELFSMAKFTFLSLTESDDMRDMEGMLGLGFMPNQEDRRFNFLSQLVDKRVIQSGVFVIELLGGGRGSLIFGRIPTDILQDYNHYGNCRINTSIKMQHDSAWLCNIKSLTFGREYNANGGIIFDNAVVKFDVTSSKTTVPIKYLLQLEKLYFDKAIETGDCNFGIKNGYYTYTCLAQDHPSFQEISLSFGEWIIHIPMESLFTFDPKDNEYEFNIYNRDGIDEFVIGMNIMKNYRMVFDESNAMIGFYNPKNSYVAYIGETPLVPPKIPDDNGGLQPVGPGGDKDRPLQPPVKEPTDEKPVPIPEQKSSFFQKFFMFIGVFSLITGFLFIAWLGFRYYRRKKYNDPSFYYKATDEFFKDGSRLE